MHPDGTSIMQICITNDNDNTYNDRYLNPNDINVTAGYRIEVFAYGLDSPVNMVFTDDNMLIIAESGLSSGNPRVLRLIDDRFDILADNFASAITGVNYLNGILYVSHRGRITRVSRDGLKQNLITGLPSNGDYFNGKVVFGPDRRTLYFGQGTVTNSGVVGLDNQWLSNHPLLCDYPGDYIILNGQNYETQNTANQFAPDEIVSTGAFSPYGTPNIPIELRKEFKKASGSILRANLDGTMLELFAWGFRNPLNLEFDSGGQLYVANMGYDNRGSRPIANAPDEFFTATPGLWYGWPDFAGGDPVSLPRFTPEGGFPPELLIKNMPNIPPDPFTTFPSNSNIMGFDFDYYRFGPYGDAYIAEFGSTDPQQDRGNTSFAGTGHRISKIDMKTRTVSTFAINKSGFPSYISQEGGFGKPIDVKFGPDSALYVLDMGVEDRNNPGVLLPNTGTIWRIFKTS
ncbi:MAG: repeat containing protein [Herbinix sp.]|jgi:glucose/arabinose dehydrogenase|nr:repeat containing protein [Herbinix sp.]